ncbi:UDP-galactofuranosyl transferase GlfT1 [[Flavobacterium] thermophilum]|nr:UDP-galactofuranosyl transferase GlfT1 [[Flavobacterium] thermophilum]
MKVCAIVVTFNRKQLLRECLEALLNQTYELEDIYVIDNASNDGTSEFVKKEYPNVNLVQLPKNIGGAGGFYEGIKIAYSNNYDWYWILDDDTIPQLNALEALLAAYNRFEEKKPILLSSKVIWKDGTIHPMNEPNIRNFDLENAIIAARANCINLRSTSFVSVLIKNDVIEKFGFPIKELFIWNDDYEYTSRILKNEFGVLVPDSVVVHKTREKYTPLLSAGNRYFYEIRNKIWLLRTKSFTRKEKVLIFLRVINGIWGYLKVNKFSIKKIIIVIHAILEGIFKSGRVKKYQI